MAARAAVLRGERTMDLGLLSGRRTRAAVADFLAAKLEAEASPFLLHRALETEPASVLLVDVRDRESYEREHIRGAVNARAEGIVTGLDSLPGNRLIVCYGWDITCALAPRAALELAAKGHRVKYLFGGIEEWKRKGFSVERALHGERRL